MQLNNQIINPENANICPICVVRGERKLSIVNLILALWSREYCIPDLVAVSVKGVWAEVCGMW